LASRLQVAAVWGAHAPSRAGDDALVIANFSGQALPGKGTFPVPAQIHCGEAPQSAREGACAPQKTDRALADFNVTASRRFEVEDFAKQIPRRGESGYDARARSG